VGFLWGIFGIDMNVGLDALVRLIIVTMVMTVTVMALIYLERKFVGRIQMRLGPMRTGPYGTLQSIADALKLLTKEDLRPASADRWLFELAPFVTFVPVFMTLLALPFMEGWGVRPAARAVLHRRGFGRDGHRLHHGRLGIRQQIRAARRRPFGCPTH
jgi:NADH:ubiquinone oxidoreductase subunit H